MFRTPRREELRIIDFDSVGSYCGIAAYHNEHFEPSFAVSGTREVRAPEYFIEGVTYFR